VVKFNLAKLGSRGGFLLQTEILICRFFGISFGIWYFSVFVIATSIGDIGIVILKYLGILYRYRLPTQD